MRNIRSYGVWIIQGPKSQYTSASASLIWASLFLKSLATPTVPKVIRNDVEKRHFDTFFLCHASRELAHVMDTIILCAMWLDTVTNVPMEIVVFNPYQPRPAFSISVHRSNQLSAVTLGELSLQQTDRQQKLLKPKYFLSKSAAYG